MAGTGGSRPPLALLLLLPPSLADVPAVDRGRPHFYGAVADRQPVTVAWAAEPAGGDTVLTLTVGGAANPGEVRKPDVRPLLAGRFQVLDRPDPPADPGAVRFAYTLRPVPGGPREVPSLRFAYYRPAFPEGKRFQTAYAEPLAVPAADPAPPAALAVPDLPAVPPPGATVPGWAWLVPPLLVPPLVLAGVPLVRRRFPDAARRAELRRVAAVRDVLDALATADRRPDPAGATAAAVRRYLAARRPADPTAIHALLARCDAARFGPAGDAGPSLATEAAELVRAAEGG